MSILKAKIKDDRSNRLNKMKNEIANPRSFKNLQIQIDAGLLRRFKIKAATENITMTELLIGFVETYLKDS